jgi:hypothetical protein
MKGMFELRCRIAEGARRAYSLHIERQSVDS